MNHPNGQWHHPQQPQPYPQQHSQYPQHQYPQHPYPQQYGPPPRRKRTGLVVGLSLGLVGVIAAAVTTGIVLNSEQDTPRTATGSTQPKKSAAPLWTAEFTSEIQHETELLGGWADDEVVVRGQENAITGYSLHDGEVIWELPANGIKLCGMSTTAVDGFGAISFGKPVAGKTDSFLCNEVQLVDITTGTPKWSVEAVPSTDRFPPDDISGMERTEIVGDVVVFDDGGDLIGLDLATGARRWYFDSIDNNPVGRGERPGPCAIGSKVVSDTRITLEQACSEEAFVIGGDITVVTTVDARTGQKVWSTPVPTSIVAAGQGPETPVPVIVGADPPALFLDRSVVGGAHTLLPFDSATGAIGREIELPGQLALTGGGDLDRAPRTTTVDGLLSAVVIGKPDGDCAGVEGLLTVDLRAGKPISPEPHPISCVLSPVGVQDGAVVVLSSGTDEERPSIHRVDPKTGESESSGPLPEDDSSGGLAGVVHVVGDRVVVLPVSAKQSSHAVLVVPLPKS
ncbi:outer membrane protein assembly factor BamB family protein [Umezawaea beigongshangensis]|uniref:outer membrane protein assembly factor BamB family protein n=1 Tax=Umezawaea beigongshangensis TaxID=2780383 RepID=UPI0018F1B70B|nr:PQQ-binding-like beta-propeller repeat protein [Umezawaea beigongshangensis]